MRAATFRRAASGRLAPVLALGLCCCVAAPVGAAASYFLTVDVPSDLGGSTVEPHDLVRYGAGGYSLVEKLPPGSDVNALLRDPYGPWYFAPASPVTLGTVDFQPRDVVIWDGSSTPLFYGESLGIPDYARIDGLAVEVTSTTVLFLLSFDVPLTLDGTDYLPADIVSLDAFGGAGFALYWDSAGAGVPSSANADGIELDGADRLAMTFDAPVTLGGSTFLPGQLVRWDGGNSFSLYAADPSWPEGARPGGFTFVPAAGAVADGTGGSTPLRARRLPGGQVELTWGASCALLDSDFAVYEGTLGGMFNDPIPATCTTGGATTLAFTPDAGNGYFLVVPRNEVSEGSYGEATGQLQRPPSTDACLPQEIDLVCE